MAFNHIPRHIPRISPTDFAHSVLRVDLWNKQREVLSALLEHRRVAVKAGNGLGKGFSAAVAVMWFLHTHDPAIVLSTAPTFRQVRYILWRQIHGLHRRAPDVLKGKLLDTRWELRRTAMPWAFRRYRRPVPGLPLPQRIYRGR